MLNPNAEKWVQRLEKNDLPQTRHIGHDSDGYCCLMVACVVFEEETGKTLPRDKHGYFIAGELADFSGGMVANEPDATFEEVREWLGLRTSTGEFIDDDGEYIHDNLVDLNDSSGLSFPEIAEIIRRHPLGLFTAPSSDTSG